MKERVKIVKIETDTLTKSVKMLDTGKNFLNSVDAAVYLRMNKELENGDYTVLKIYHKDNGHAQ